MQLLDVLRRHFDEFIYYPEMADDIEDLIAAAGNAAGALLYASLFCIPLIEIDGMVFQLIQKRLRVDEYPESVREYRERVRGNLKEVEQSFNLIFVQGLFDPDRRDMTDEEELMLAQTLAEAWRAWIHWRYPRRRFTVEILSAEETGDAMGMGITFYEDR